MGDHCGRPVHKACYCIRTPGHDGRCNCAYADDKTPGPAPAEPATQQEGSRHG